jgi:DNA-binding GntR family transcriptional regulator
MDPTENLRTLRMDFAIRTVSKSEQVCQAILLQILGGQLLPGQRLIEAKLASQLNVSQATVNAALQDLHNQGLVTKNMNRSTKVNRYTRTEIDNLFRVRLALEPVAAGLAAERFCEEAQLQLREHVDQMRLAARKRDLAKFCFADYLFHQEVYKQSGNSFLSRACQAIASAPFAYILCDHLDWLPTDYLMVAEDHQAIIQAMEYGPETAVNVTRERITEWLRHSLRALERDARVPAATQVKEQPSRTQAGGILRQ